MSTITIAIPENSFIQFIDKPDNDCIDNKKLCLQTREITDLSFQIGIPLTQVHPANQDFFVSLCKDCNDIGVGESIIIGRFTWRESLDQSQWVGVIGWVDFPLSDYINAGECYGLCLHYTDQVQWKLAGATLPTYPYRLFSLSATINGTIHTFFFIIPYPLITNINDLIVQLNGTFPTYGTWSTDGTDIFLSNGGTSAITRLVINWIKTDGSGSTIITAITETYTGNAKICSDSCYVNSDDGCYTTLIKYRCNENAFGFQYNNDTGSGNGLSGFYNQARLSMFLKNPQTLAKKKVYRQSDGNYQKLSSVMEKEYACEVDWLTDDWHTKLAIALEHDDVQFYNDVTGQWEKVIFDESETYVINWSHNDRGTNFALAPADFKIKKMPFANFNANCE